MLVWLEIPAVLSSDPAKYCLKQITSCIKRGYFIDTFVLTSGAGEGLSYVLICHLRLVTDILSIIVRLKENGKLT